MFFSQESPDLATRVKIIIPSSDRSYVPAGWWELRMIKIYLSTGLAANESMRLL
jgi:hypothetical protein